MQKNFLLSLFSIILIVLAGCMNPVLPGYENRATDENNKDKKKPDSSGQVQFSLGRGHSAVSPAGSQGHHPQQSYRIVNARQVVISVENAAGTKIFTNKQLMVYQFSGTFISEPVSLAAGSYKLTGYLVLDQAGKVIFAAPKSGSNKDHLVNQPLPLAFNVTKDNTTQVAPEVIVTAETAASEFGYATFSFDVVKTFDFLITVMVHDPVQDKLVATNAKLQITNNTHSYSFNLSNTINRIFVNDLENSYEVVVIKAGYKKNKAAYTAAQLKGFFNDPLVVVLKAKQPGNEFKKQQSITTSGGADCEFFTIGNNNYLAVANHFNGSSYKIDSKIYKWNGSSFAECQAIATQGAVDWEYFKINNKNFLAVANYYNNSTINIDSKIYKWNGSSFAEFQAIATNGAFDWQYFKIGGESYLAVANSSNNSSFNIDSKIYKWNGSSFAEFQVIGTSGAHDWEHFKIGGESYLAVANFYNGSTRDIDSKIYKWDGNKFAAFQSIATHGAFDWQYFKIDGKNYLAVANYNNNFTHNNKSKIYQWNGNSFSEFQSIATHGAANWEFFKIGNKNYLTVANNRNDLSYRVDSEIYQWDGSTFTNFQFIPTHGAYDCEFFTIGNKNFLFIANSYNGNSHNINSVIYKAAF